MKNKRECYIGEDGYCHVPLANGKGEAICEANRIEEVNKHNWILTNYGYAATTIDKKLVLMHRFLFPGFKIIDHKNRIKLDNSENNIREATYSENARNVSPYRGHFKGVTFSKKKRTGKYVSRIYFNKRKIEIGCFNTEEEAAYYYDIFAFHYFKEFAVLNFPDKINEYKNKIPNTVDYRERKKTSNKYTSKFIGVCFNKKANKFRAEAKIAGKPKHIGYFEDESFAAHAYDLFIIKNNLNRKLNFPRESYDEAIQNEKKMVVFKA